MTWVARQIIRSYPKWDSITKIAFVIAFVLLIIAVILLLLAPADARGSVFAGAVALIMVMQLIVLWGNRHMVTPFTQAQRRYLAGDLEGALTILEAARANDTADMKALTLLGSTYRQFGRLDESREVLYEALDNAADDHFPLYNLGRTLAAAGDYSRAVELYQRALANNAPPITRFDLAEAYFLMGETAQAAEALAQVEPLLKEPFRQVMAAWWRSQMGIGEPPTPPLIKAGLPYWGAVAERFRQTPYGTTVAAHVAALQSSVKGDAQSDV